MDSWRRLFQRFRQYCASEQPRICAAEVGLDDNLVKVLKAGGELTLASTNMQGKPNPLKVTLEGFTAAYDGPPIKQDALQDRQKKLEEELGQPVFERINRHESEGLKRGRNLQRRACVAIGQRGGDIAGGMGRLAHRCDAHAYRWYV